MNTTEQPLSRFIDKHGVSIKSEYADVNKNAPDWKDANHYKVTLRNKAGRRLTTYFSQGYGISGEPEVASVLDSLASDAASVDNSDTFTDWCMGLGYDADSRKAEKVYRTCQRQAEQLKRFLGEDAYNDLLWHTERE